MRTIDGDERRRVLAEAVWRVIRRDGFEAASVRVVAAEAGLSPGSVRHFFASQEELQSFAMTALVDRMTARVQAVLPQTWSAPDVAEVPAPQRARTAVLAVLQELLPLDEERVELFAAHLQFVTRSMVQPALRPTVEGLAEETEQLLRHLVQSLVDVGATRPDLDVEQAAATLSTLLDGLTLRCLTLPRRRSSAAALRVLEDCLDGWRVGS